MTFQWHNLLAADDDGLVNILILVVMVIIGLIGHLIKKAQEKRQTDEADRKVEEAKRRHARQPHAAPPRRPTTAAEQAAAVLQSAVATKAKPPPPPRQPVAGVKPQPVGARADLAQGVREEVRKVRQHLSAEEADRRRRLVHIESLKSGIGAEPAPAEAPIGEKPKIRLNLSSPKAARTAIICAEVLGLPKALRSDPEPWER